MIDKLFPGTMVILISGGPVMSVSDTRDQSDNLVSCEWFVDNEIRRDSFNLENLVIVRTP